MITATCGFCGRAQNVDDAQAGSQFPCGQCGGAVTVPLPEAPPPPPPPEGPVKLALWSLMLGVSSVVPCLSCLSAPIALILGFIALSRSTSDAVAYAPARRKAMVGIALALLFTGGQFVGLLAWGSYLQREEAREIAMADAALARKDFASAKPVYERHLEATRKPVRAACRAKLGRILFAEGSPDLAREQFELALGLDPTLLFTCDDPAVNALFAEVRRRRKVGP